MNGFSIRASSLSGQPGSVDAEYVGGQPSTKPVRTLIIVARDQPDLWRALAGQFAESTTVQVVPDRRHWGRRQRVHWDEADRRRSDRRRPPHIERDVRRRSFVIVRQQGEAGILDG